MPSGRVPIRPKQGYYYKTDSGEVMYILTLTKDPTFPFLAEDSQGRLHRYTAKGRYFHGFGNHPLHLNHQLRANAKEIFYQMHRGD